MFRKFLWFCLCLIVIADTVNAAQYAYQVNFKNKNGTQPFSDSLTFLTTRSMARRASQRISLDSTDLPVVKAYVDSVLHVTGGKIHCTSKWLNLCVILLSDSSQIHNAEALAFVGSTKLVAVYSGILHKGPADESAEPVVLPTASRTTSGSAYYSQTWNQTLMVNGDYLHDIGFKGTGKLIAVLDAGYAGADTHPGFDSLRTSGRIVDGHNFTLASSSIYGYDSHGTEILSTMAGYVPNTYVGSAPLASYALYISEDDNSEQPIELLNMLAASERADSIGADIISSSLGYNTFDNTAYNFVYASDLDGKTTIAAKAANMATQKGMLFVASAGNEGDNSWMHILTPGDADSALTVGNVNLSGVNASASGYGPNAAGQVKPDVCTLGEPGAVFNSTGGYIADNGTSISTPEIAGWAACLWQAVPGATPAMLKNAIRRCASRYTSPGTQIGYGIPNFKCTVIDLDVIDTPLPQSTELDVLIPNPVVENINIIITLHTAQEVYFRLTDLTGKEVLQFSATLISGKNAPITYNVANLPGGIYILKAATATHQQVLKVVKQ